MLSQWNGIITYDSITYLVTASTDYKTADWIALTNVIFHSGNTMPVTTTQKPIFIILVNENWSINELICTKISYK